ncbi:putative uncharacterized protein DDB_G0283051 isoform X2 [Cephus cinctus]|uniref:Uncharacterized protein n=1 Tax=Cephus cinctus TaxID=211228 RepID=A0AAJ7RUK4_CEPCN|nr:putative uncharacterized protein DDB_G0283051 isoform X2 [Cephus cinctus]
MGMRQVVVLEPAGSVLVIRQTSLGNGVTSVTTTSNTIAGSNSHGGHEHRPLANGTVSTLSANDHNQNRIVVVRSSSTSSCMTTLSDTNANGNGNCNANNDKINQSITKLSERNDHPRNDHHKNQQDGSNNRTEINSGHRQKIKENSHDSMADSKSEVDQASDSLLRIALVRDSLTLKFL